MLCSKPLLFQWGQHWRIELNSNCEHLKLIFNAAYWKKRLWRGKVQNYYFWRNLERCVINLYLNISFLLLESSLNKTQTYSLKYVLLLNPEGQGYAMKDVGDRFLCILKKPSIPRASSLHLSRLFACSLACGVFVVTISKLELLINFVFMWRVCVWSVLHV